MKTKYLTELLEVIESDDISEETIKGLVVKMPEYEADWLIEQLDGKRKRLLDLIVMINKYRQNNE